MQFANKNDNSIPIYFFNGMKYDNSILLKSLLKSTISCCDVCSLYPYIMTQKLPISDHKFVSKFNNNKYGQNINHSCLLSVEIYTTKKVLNDKILPHV